MSRAGPMVHLCWVRPLRRIGFQPQPVCSKQHLFENLSLFFWDQRILSWYAQSGSADPSSKEQKMCFFFFGSANPWGHHSGGPIRNVLHCVDWAVCCSGAYVPCCMWWDASPYSFAMHQYLNLIHYHIIYSDISIFFINSTLYYKLKWSPIPNLVSYIAELPQQRTSTVRLILP